MMEIHFKTIPQEEQRYKTSGDYWVENGVFEFRVTKMSNQIYELAIFVHELIEAFLCLQRGIKWEDIDKFDIEFEKNRKEGDLSEPGDSPDSPYRKEHRFAENLERQIIHESGLDWGVYNSEVENL